MVLLDDGEEEWVVLACGKRGAGAMAVVRSSDARAGRFDGKEIEIVWDGERFLVNGFESLILVCEGKRWHYRMKEKAR